MIPKLIISYINESVDYI